MVAALGEALTGVVACAGLLAGVWFMARGSRASVGRSSASSSSGAASAPAAVAEQAEPAEPDASTATTFRHGTIRLAGEPGGGDVGAAEPAPRAAPALALEPAPAAAPETASASVVKPAPAPEPAPESDAPVAPTYVPPPIPPGPRTSFRQGRIRLGGLERGISRDAGDEPPGAA